MRTDASGENSAKGGILEEQRVIGADKGRVTGNTCQKTNQGEGEGVTKPRKRTKKGGKRETGSGREESNVEERKGLFYSREGKKKEERKKRKKDEMEPHPRQTWRRFVLPSPSDIFFFFPFLFPT